MSEGATDGAVAKELLFVVAFFDAGEWDSCMASASVGAVTCSLIYAFAFLLMSLWDRVLKWLLEAKGTAAAD